MTTPDVSLKPRSPDQRPQPLPRPPPSPRRLSLGVGATPPGVAVLGPVCLFVGHLLFKTGPRLGLTRSPHPRDKKPSITPAAECKMEGSLPPRPSPTLRAGKINREGFLTGGGGRRSVAADAHIIDCISMPPPPPRSRAPAVAG